MSISSLLSQGSEPAQSWINLNVNDLKAVSILTTSIETDDIKINGEDFIFNSDSTSLPVSTYDSSDVLVTANISNIGIGIKQINNSVLLTLGGIVYVTPPAGFNYFKFILPAPYQPLIINQNLLLVTVGTVSTVSKYVIGVDGSVKIYKDIAEDDFTSGQAFALGQINLLYSLS